jgi:hypothetical protein
VGFCAAAGEWKVIQITARMRVPVAIRRPAPECYGNSLKQLRRFDGANCTADCHSASTTEAFVVPGDCIDDTNRGDPNRVLLNSGHPVWKRYQPFKWWLLPHGIAAVQRC